MLVVEAPDPPKDLGKAGEAKAGGPGKVGPGRKGDLPGGQKDGQRPAPTPPGENLMGGLVDQVEVGAFFPVDLDVDEVPIHLCRRFRILEGFVGHDMAPVAGGISDGEEHRAAAPCGFFPGLLSPGIPVDGVLGMLA